MPDRFGALSVYEQNGYANRADYLKFLSESNGVSLSVVKMIASQLGPNEDFDGLVTEVEDYASQQED